MSARKDVINKCLNMEKVVSISRLDLNGGYDVNKPTIMIVDDFESIIKLFKRLVKRMNISENFNIVYSSHSDAGIKVLNELYHNSDFHIDILITDITFGGSIDIGEVHNFSLNGISLAGIIKKINPNLIYHFITGHIVTPKATPVFFDEYRSYTEDDLLQHLSYKDIPVSTNKDLFYSLVKGTRYEMLIK